MTLNNFIIKNGLIDKQKTERDIIMMKLKWNMVVCLLMIVFSQLSAQTISREDYNGPKPKYIFFFIGDGMGITQINAAESYLSAVKGENGASLLSFSKFPYHGIYTTYAANRFITGSAAAGTALACGQKTSINSIGVDSAKTKALKNIPELAKEHKMKVGIVTSVSLDHATPAAFYAHQASRNMYYPISVDLSASGFNYFGGGGFKHPEGDGKIDDKNTMANMGMGDKENLEHKQANSMEIAKSRGYRIVNTAEDFAALKKGDKKVIAISPELAGGKSIPYAIDCSAQPTVSLADFTQKGIELLDNKKGFFMMIEGGKIDWSCHANDVATTIQEVLQLDMAVQKALDFYKEHPDETLIIVGADHETGGIGLGDIQKKYESDLALLQHQKISYEGFTNLVKKYKEDNASNYNFEDGLAMLKKYFGLGDESKKLALTAYDIDRLKEAFVKSMEGKAAGEEVYEEHFYEDYGRYDPFTVTAIRLINEKAGIGWTTYSHTADPVPVRAIGPRAELFSGFFDNTDVAKNLMYLIENK
jgi:alkaline phosphatase